MKMKFLYAFLIFFSVNVLVSFLLPQIEWDMTEEKEYTVSKETKIFLKNLKENVAVKVYFSPDLIKVDQSFANHLSGALQKLDRIKRLSNDKIKVEVTPVFPMTEEEMEAENADLEKLVSKKAGVYAYFGAVLTNDTDGKRTIPFLDPERAVFFEYDFVQRIKELSNVKKPRITVMSTLPIDGDASVIDQPRFNIMEEIRGLYDVNVLSPRAPFVPEETDILMIINPGNFFSETEDAIVAYLKKGGSLLLLIDSFSETGRLYHGPGGLREPNLQSVFSYLGIAVPEGVVVADMASARPITKQEQGKTLSVLYPTRISVEKTQINGKDPITAGIPFITVSTPTYIEPAKDGKTSVVPLMYTTAGSMLLPKNVFAQLVDPTELIPIYEPSGKNYMLAARIEGKDEPFKAVVIADSDLLIDSVAERAGNVPFILNALEYLSPTDMVGTRNRALHIRTLYKMDDWVRTIRFKASLIEQQILNEAYEREEMANKIASGEIPGSVQENAQRLNVIRQDIGKDKVRIMALNQRIATMEDTIRNGIIALNFLTVPVIGGVIFLCIGKRRKKTAAKKER